MQLPPKMVVSDSQSQRQGLPHPRFCRSSAPTEQQVEACLVPVCYLVIQPTTRRSESRRRARESCAKNDNAQKLVFEMVDIVTPSERRS
jgi:hypothetical protein